MKVLLAAILLALTAQAGAVYVPPDDTGILFAKDALPMDPDLMRELSGHLATVAQQPTAGDPVRQRATAQLLALASRLDPTNRRARDINRALGEGRDIEAGPTRDRQRAGKRAWEIAQWLLSEETGKTGERVGHQLVDALRVVDPAHTEIPGYRPGGEQARWAGVVAPLNRFRGRAKPPTPPPPTPPKPEPEPEPAPPSKPRPPAPKIRLAKATVLTPLEVGADQTRRIELLRLDLQLEASPDHADMELQLLPPPTSEAALPALLDARARILGTIANEWQRLPEHQLATLRHAGELTYSPRNGTALSGPAALLFASAISGQALRDDVIFLGDVSTDGRIHSPEFGWRYLKVLREGQGARLLVPTAFEPQIRALLALEEPDFFIRYEVIAVKTLRQALNAAAADPGSPTLAEADAEFARFRTSAAPNTIGPMAVKTGVRDLLTRILTANPGHLSAKMILLQGSSWRPTRLDHDTFGRELERCLEPIERIMAGEADGLVAPELSAAAAACLRNLDPLGNRVDRAEQNFHDEARALVEALGQLARMRQSESGPPGEGTSEAFRALRTRYERLLQAFQPAPDPLPDPERKNGPRPRVFSPSSESTNRLR